jgi:hypothetical protein
MMVPRFRVSLSRIVEKPGSRRRARDLGAVMTVNHPT